MMKMINSVMVLFLSLLTHSAFAQNGVLCGTLDRELLVQVSSNGVMSLVDPVGPQGHQLVIAQLKHVDVNQSSSGPVYLANTSDAYFPNPNRYVGGARLSELQWITLAVNTASMNLTRSNVASGSLSFQKANGQNLKKLVTCTLNQAAFLSLR
jgi:hypothetical protein